MLNRLALRYAKALMGAAKAHSVENEILEEVSEIDRAFARNSELPRLIRSIGRHPARTEQVAAGLIEQLKPSPIALNFFRTLIENRRVYLLPDILDAFQHEMKRRRQIIEAEVVSIRSLDPDEKSRILDCLKSVTGRPVEIVWRIDRSILGGISVRIGDEIFDGSLLSRLNQLHDELMKE